MNAVFVFLLEMQFKLYKIVRCVASQQFSYSLGGKIFFIFDYTWEMASTEQWRSPSKLRMLLEDLDGASACFLIKPDIMSQFYYRWLQLTNKRISNQKYSKFRILKSLSYRHDKAWRNCYWKVPEVIILTLLSSPPTLLQKMMAW